MLIGSKALKQLYPSFPREPHDIDVVVLEGYHYPHDDFEDDLRVEYHQVPDHLFDLIEIVDKQRKETLLYTFKLSHLIFKNKTNWNKHAKDLVWMQNNIPGLSYDIYLLDTLIKFWKDKFNDYRIVPDFDKPNEEFFKDKVERELNHDDLHHYFCFYPELGPMFDLVKFDKTKAATDRDLTLNLSSSEFEKLIREEVYTIMFEREKKPNRAHYMPTLQKLITDLSPDWLSIHILKHLNTLSTGPCDVFERGVEKLKGIKNARKEVA